MAFCPKYGKKLSDTEKFCGACGNKHQEPKGKSEVSIKKTSYKGLVALIFFFIIVGYIALDIWAATQLEPEVSLDSIWTTISNTKGDIGIKSASTSTTMRIENPTFVPVFSFPIEYIIGYGTSEIAEGSTGVIFIAPYSTKDVYADIELSYSEAGTAIFQGIRNKLSGNEQALYVDFYMLGIKLMEISK